MSDNTEEKVSSPDEETNQSQGLGKPGTEMSLNELEKLEEAKMKARFPMGGVRGHSAFLQKKLAKGQKYFDSGDYQMARQTTAQSKAKQPPVLSCFDTGTAIPTPESVPVRKTSIIQPKYPPPPPSAPNS